MPMLRTIGASLAVAALSTLTASAQARPQLPEPPALPAPPPPPPPPAPEPPEVGGETIELAGDAPAESASSVYLDADQLRMRPRTQPSDLVRQVPGLVASQHAGGGKADQYFIRGFDADHGTDVAIFVDGVPVNLTSHGHGQGYADTHWLIPETVASVAMHKGPYAARYGDFYTAGALELATIDRVDRNTIWIAAGAPLTGSTRFERYDRRLVGMASPRLRAGRDDASLIALQIAETDGPFLDAQSFRQGNALLKWRGDVGPGALRLAATWYAAHWSQSGQIPAGEVAAGRLDRFGAIDPTEGGVASRASAQLGFTARDDDASWRVDGYAVTNRLRLFSNFTLFARDVDDGDQIEQTDARLLYGFDAAYRRWLAAGPVRARLTAGAQLRADDAETSLWHAARRARLAGCFDEGDNPCNHTFNRIRAIGAYAEATVIPARWLALLPGLRLDQLTWDVEDLDPQTVASPTASPGGSAQRSIVSPKLSAVVSPTERVSVFANSGLGFHSNDARAAVASGGGRGALARAYGGELGVRVTPVGRARISADVWYLYLTSEQVWSGDAGGTEPSEPTRRYGVDLELAYQPLPWLSLDASLSLARSTLVANQGNGGALALAPRVMGSGGAAVRNRCGFVSARVRGIGDRPGNDDGSLTAEGYVVVDLVAGRDLMRGLHVELTVTNLLDADWREAQFAETSRVEPDGELIEQMHFTPGLPLTATIELVGSL